jgi:hypothetical protein
MGKIWVRVKAPFGEIVVEGESAQEILKTLKTMPPQFVNEVGGLISTNLTPSLKTNPVCLRTELQHSHPN